jgi:hypothetical protein
MLARMEGDKPEKVDGTIKIPKIYYESFDLLDI